MEICGDNRFEIIAKAKAHLLDATNIDTSEDEMKVLDSFLFRCWQMGWLDRYERKDESKTQMKTQNSNLTFEKRTMRDCYNCKRYETEGECVECHYEPKDECAKEYEELGLKELKELIKADHKDEPQTERSE